jgi:hypothetical protein
MDMFMKVPALVILIILIVSMLYWMQRAKTKLPKIRRIAGLEAIDEAVGRAVEMGRPVLCVKGGGVSPEEIAGITIDAYVARLCARLSVPLIYPCRHPDTLAVAQDYIREAYLLEGKLEEYKPEEIIRFVSNQQYGYAAGVMGIIEREKPAVGIFVGWFASENMAITEPGARIGSIQIGGTARNPAVMPSFAVTCDHLLISDEVYAAGAYLSKDPIQLGTVIGGDPMKIIAIILLLAGGILALMGNNAVYKLLGG